MIQPTIGRVVLVYRPGVSDQYESAQIQYVHPHEAGEIARHIDVSGIGRDGKPYVLHSVELKQGTEGSSHPTTWKETPDEPFACWMPYQQQAARGHTVDPFAGRSF